MRTTILLVMLMILPGASSALDKCKVKTTGRDAHIEVFANDVSGTLRYGWTASRVVGRFDNEATCVDRGRAKKCTLGPEGTLERVTPPPSCTVHLADGADTCQATLRRCTPSLRPVCPPDMERIGSECIERTRNPALNFVPAQATCVARGRRLCSSATLMACDALNISNSRSGSCGWATDNGAWLYADGTLSESGQNVFNRLFIYRSDNIVHEQTDSSGGMYSFFCCGALGTE